MSVAVSVACCPGREMLCWPVYWGQLPLRLSVACHVWVSCLLRGGVPGTDAGGSVDGEASQRWWEGPRGLFVGLTCSLLGDVVALGPYPGGVRGRSVVRNPVFTLDYSVL